MASSLSEEEDSASGSLFEGMVLFSASDLTSSPPQPPSPPPSPPPPLSPTFQQHQVQPQPLDEDLFSNLTLQTPESPSEDHPTSTTTPHPPPPSLNRHSSSRKKKRAVRIGYARDTLPLPLHDHHPTQTQTLTLDDDPSPPSNDRETLTLFLAKDEVVTTPSSTIEEDHDFSPQETLTKDETLFPAALEEQTPSIPTASPTDDDGDGNGEQFEDRLVLVRDRILEKIDGIRKKASLLSAKRKELGTRRRRAMERVNSAVEEHKQLERELEEAVEAEDFEGAERVSESVAEKEKEKDGLAGELRKMELEYDEVDSGMHGVLESLIAAEEEGATFLEEFGKVRTKKH